MAEAIQDFRHRMRWTQADLAEKIGVTRSAMASYESGRVSPNRHVVQKLLELGFAPGTSAVREEPSRYVLLQPTQAIVPKQAVMIPFAGEVPCSTWGDPLDSEEHIEVESVFVKTGRFAAKVVGDSCFPALLPGDITIWEHDFSPPYGTIVLAQRKGDHGCTVKKLEHDGGRAVLSPLNPVYDRPEDGEGWGVIARLVAVVRVSEAPRRTWYWEPGLRPSHIQ